MFFTDTHSKLYRVLGGGLHAIAHLVRRARAGLALDAVSRSRCWAWTTAVRAQLLLAGLLTFVGGALVGGFVIGLYLLISIARVRPACERGVLVAAHPGLQAVAAAARRCGRGADDLVLRDRPRAAPLARGLQTGRPVRAMTRARPAPREIDRGQRATAKLNQACAAGVPRQSRPSISHRVVARARAPNCSAPGAGGRSNPAAGCRARATRPWSSGRSSREIW